MGSILQGVYRCGLPVFSLRQMTACLFRAQLENFTRALRAMDGMTKAQLAGIAPLAG